MRFSTRAQGGRVKLLLLTFLSIVIGPMAGITAMASSTTSADSFLVESSYPFRNVYTSAWSPDGRYIAVIEKFMETVKIVDPFKPDSSPVFTIQNGMARELASQISWSPNSKYILLRYIDRKSWAPILQVYQVQDGNLVYELIPRPSWVSNWYKDEWSPDSHRILFYSSSRGAQNDQNPENLFVVDLAKTTGDKIVFKTIVETSWDVNSNFIHNAHWSPDGKFIAGAHVLQSSKVRYYVIDPISAKEVFEFIPETQEQNNCWLENTDARWSPNSRWILVSYGCEGISPMFTTLVLDPNKQSLKEALVFTRQSNSALIDSWTPDSQKLWSVDDGNYQSDLILTPVFQGPTDPNEKRYHLNIDTNICCGSAAMLSPDGRYLVYNGSNGYSSRGDLKVFDLNKEKVVFVHPSLGLTAWESKWSPDSKTISFLEKESTKPGNFLLRIRPKNEQ